MSILFQNENDDIILFIKGADNVILEKIICVNEEEK